MRDDNFHLADGEYGMVMPFLPVESKGGPYNDEAYCAGWEMGVFEVKLQVAKALGLEPDMPLLIHQTNKSQADLIAMKYGFVCEFTDFEEGQVIGDQEITDDTWAQVEVYSAESLEDINEEDDGDDED